MQRQTGFTLVEVLVAAFILATALLGYAATQTLSLKNAKSAYYRIQATQLAYDLIDRIRANNKPEALTIYQTKGSTPSDEVIDPNCFTTTGCSAGDMASSDLKQWSTNVDNAIKRGTGVLTFNNDLYTITISWGDSADSVDNSFTTTFRL